MQMGRTRPLCSSMPEWVFSRFGLVPPRVPNDSVLQISVPTNASGSQQALILFPEANITLRNYHIHPLNSRGRPYAYPPDSSPLIQRAARVLRLDNPLDEYYSEALERTIIHSSTPRGTTPRRNTVTALSPNSLGSIAVQNLNFAFLTPRYTPRVTDGTDRSSDGTASESRSSRRMSFSAASLATPDGRASSKYQCIIVMELVVPIVNKPEISPYMVRHQAIRTSCAEH